MFFEIDPAGSQAIYEQVVQQVKFAIAAGGLQEDERIPSVRELSKTLAINPNTVARAYRGLQDEGVVYPRRGQGLAVAPDACARCKIERKSIFEDRFRRLFDEAIRSRLEPPEIREMVEHLLNTVLESTSRENTA
ncbi:MAG: GntR family transcriptional regulator [Planctomycetaceae bacterium]|nr:GntR family transcriptional regulator [Planctomycetaceae bacterium]